MRRDVEPAVGGPGGPAGQVTDRRHRTLPITGAGLLFGGDYNPEQWPEEVWAEDARLMVEAGVNIVTVGVFSWARLEPAEGVYDFDWLDRVIEGLHAAGIAVDLATPSAGPPPWLSHTYPASLPVTVEGVRLGYGARESFCPSSVDYRAAAGRLADALGARYAAHPAVVMWHVGNEFGAHVGGCHCPASRAAFREWLRHRYGDVEHLNEAWGTSFWSQHYQSWDEITTPVRAPMPVNPAQQLDFARFTSDEYRACYEAERDILRGHDAVRPITTNLMLSNCKNLDYWTWADAVDVVANDHYLMSEFELPFVDLALAADLSRSLHRGAPWILMEHSTSAVNWQPRNIAKEPGEMRRNALTHIARGSEGALFFQWRASRRGSEQFHSAMLPHGGTGTRVWREVCALGADLAKLGPVRGSRVVTDIALYWDWQSWWATELEYRPATDLSYLERVRTSYSALWAEGRTVDIVGPDSDLAGYRALVVPSAFLLRQHTSDRIRRWVTAGGQLLVSFFSGIVDETTAIHEGGFPGPLREVLGLGVEEFHPLAHGEVIGLDDGTIADFWSEAVVPTTAETMLRFVGGPDDGEPALTRNRLGAGTAWYLATRVAAEQLRPIIRRVLADPRLGTDGESPDGESTDGVEIVRRRGPGKQFAFVLNHNPGPVIIDEPGTDLLTGSTTRQRTIAGGGVVVVASSTAGNTGDTSERTAIS